MAITVRWKDSLVEPDPPPYSETTNSTSSRDSPHPPPKAGRRGILKNVQPSRRSSEPDSESIYPQIIQLSEYSALPFQRHRLDEYYTADLLLSLADLFQGRFLLITFEQSDLDGHSNTINLPILIPPGCPEGTVYSFRNAGHQFQDGEERHRQHLRFTIIQKRQSSSSMIPFHRDGDDLYTEIRLPWTDRLSEESRSFHIEGIDGTP